MELKKMRKLFNGTLWIVFLPILLGLILRKTWVMLFAILFALVWAVLVVIFWRCPECGSKLLRPDMKIKHCPECGVYLGLDGDD